MFRTQYARWKEECRELFPLVGSGRFITAPVITDDGQPIQDPLVLLQVNPDKGEVVIPFQDNSGVGVDIIDASSANNLKKVTDKRVIQWMLTLHQIGLFPMHSLFYVIIFCLLFFDIYDLSFMEEPSLKILIYLLSL